MLHTDSAFFTYQRMKPLGEAWMDVEKFLYIAVVASDSSGLRGNSRDEMCVSIEYSIEPRSNYSSNTAHTNHTTYTLTLNIIYYKRCIYTHHMIMNEQMKWNKI